MTEARKTFTSSNRSHSSRLLAIWLFLIVLPALVLMVSFDHILKESEGYILDRLKIRMLQEMNDFRSKLSFGHMLELKMRDQSDEFARESSDARSMAALVSDKIQIPVTAVFYLNPETEDLSYYLAESVKPTFSMVSHTMLRNYLQSLIKKNRASPDDNDYSRWKGSSKFSRSIKYFRNLFNAAGEIELQLNRVVRSYSGNAELGRLLFFAIPLADSGSAIVVFREIDISLQQLASHAKTSNLFSDLQRGFALSTEGRQAVYMLGNEMQHFNRKQDGTLILSAVAPEEFLLRRVSKGTLVPIMLTEALENLPLIQITAPVSSQQHPLRKITGQAEKAALLLILFSSVVLLRIYLFGYGSGLRIRSRLLICVIGASILPFSTFLAGLAYHEHFAGEFEKSEIDQYLNLQQDYLNKSLNARIDFEERKMTELAETLGRLSWDEADQHLTRWIKTSVAALIVYSQDEREKTYTTDPNEKLNATELSMKTLSFMSIRNAIRSPSDTSQGSDGSVGAMNIKVKGIGIILENVGRLQETISDKAVTLFSAFPVFAENRRFDKPRSIILIKYYTADIIHDFLKTYPEFLKNEIKGRYRVRSCFIPIRQAFRLPPEHDAICSSGFSPARWSHLARQVLNSRSTAFWSDENSAAVAGFHNRLQCIIIHTSERSDTTASPVGAVFLPALLYFLLMVATTVVFIAKILIDPIDMLKQGADLVAAGKYQQHIELQSGDEFEPLASSFNEMAAGLYQRELLTSYVSQDVIDEVSSDITLLPGGERVEASVVFCSLSGFKELSLSSSPEEIVTKLGRLIEIADNAAVKHGGVMDKLIEDTVMLVFRQRSSDKNYAIAACRAALDINRAFADTDKSVKVATGIASGSAVSGKIGSKTGKLDFTLIGNPVNLAARLKAQAHKADNTGIIVCPATIRLLKGQARLRFIERTEIKGRSRTFPLYELLELRD